MKGITIPDKAEPVFEKWLMQTPTLERVYYSDEIHLSICGKVISFDKFYQLPLEMQFGVWLKFLDEQAIHIDIDLQIEQLDDEDIVWYCAILFYDSGCTHKSHNFQTRNGVTISAINKALEILEGRLLDHEEFVRNVKSPLN